MESPTQSGAALRARTKIVATVGPACATEQQLLELIQAGVDVFRLNMAHGEIAEKAEIVDRIQRASERLQRRTGILVDLAGPKIRLGELPGDIIECTLGAEFRFVRGETSGAPNELVTTYEPLVDELAVGDQVMLADGTVGMTVIGRGPDWADCRVIQAGAIRSRQGVNLPGVKLSTPAMTADDRLHAEWATKIGADFISLSFVRSPDDIRGLKQLIKSAGSRAKIVAKIEKPEALSCLEAIVEATDCLMVARGDLGVEIDVARVPLVQKQIIALANRHQKPVITATQMLDSMQNSPRPTRAEASDVANAILDGTDACMLSGETAIGKYPRQAVSMMNRIALATEQLFEQEGPRVAAEVRIEGLHQITEAVVAGVGLMAQRLKAKLIVVASHSGATALALSKQRSFVPTLGVSDSDTTLRQMALYWGVTPLWDASVSSTEDLLRDIEAWGRQDGGLVTGDRVILVAGTHSTGSGHNAVLVHEVR